MRRQGQALDDFQATLLLYQQRVEPPAGWTDDRLEQAQHYIGAVYLALNAVVEMLSSASVWVEKRKPKALRLRKPSKPSKPSKQKALVGAGGAGNDEQYEPCEADDTVLADIVAAPNPHETMASLLGYMALQYGLTGNAPVWLVPGEGHEKPVEIYALPEATLVPVVGPTLEEPEGMWRVMPYYQGRAWQYAGALPFYGAILPGSQIRKLRNPHPLFRLDGYSPLSACGLQVDILEAIDRSRHAAFLRQAQLDLLIQIPGLSKAEAEKFRADFEARHCGPANARKAAIVSMPAGMEGEIKVERLGESAREMDYMQSWEQACKWVLAMYGVPPAITGLAASTSYAEFYASLIQFHFRVSQIARRMSDFFTRHLAEPWSEYPGQYRIKIEVPRPRNVDEDRSRMLSMAQAGAVTVNELRRANDLPPLKDGDVPPSIYLQKLTTVLDAGSRFAAGRFAAGQPGPASVTEGNPPAEAGGVPGQNPATPPAQPPDTEGDALDDLTSLLSGLDDMPGPEDVDALDLDLGSLSELPDLDDEPDQPPPTAPPTGPGLPRPTNRLGRGALPPRGGTTL